MNETWRKFRALGRVERQMLAQALMLLPLTALGLRCLGLRRCQAVLAAFVPAPASLVPSDPVALIASADYAVAVASYRGLTRANCLQRSLVLWCLLRRTGVMTELRIGVRRNDGRFEAHAWIERGGCVLNDSADVRTRFTPFTSPILTQESAAR